MATHTAQVASPRKPGASTRRQVTSKIEQDCRGLARRRARVRRTPTVIQMEAVECGAASLAIVLAHFGRFVPLEELRLACSVSRDGSTAKNVLGAAAAYGLVGTGKRMEVPDLMRLGHPVIAFWAFQHFFVVNGFERRRSGTIVLVNDPSSGPRRMPIKEFDEGFTGVVLDFVPGADFRVGGRPERTLGLLAQRMSGSGRGLPLALFASLVLVLPGVLSPVLSQHFLDSVYVPGGAASPWPVCLGFVACAVGALILAKVQVLYLRLTEARIAMTTSARFVNRMLRLPLGFFLQRRAAELSRRIASNRDVAQVLTRDLVVTSVNLVLVLVYGAVLLFQDAPLALLAMSVSLLNLIVLRAVMRRRQDGSAALLAEESRLAVTTLHTLHGIETVKSSGSEHVAFTRWAGFMARATSESQRLGVSTAILTAVPPVLATFDSGLVMLVGGLRASAGIITVGLLFSFQTVLVAFTRPMTQLSNQASRLQSMGSQLERLRDVETYALDGGFLVSGASCGRLSGDLRFRDVSYSFGPLLPPLIEHLDLRMQPGRRVALVGASGSGKSTVGRLAAGLLEPTSGSITFDGLTRQEWTRQSMAAAVSYVDQQVTLFEGTVRDNVCLWDAEIPDAQVVAALKDAEILAEISRRPGGMTSRVAEGGANYSGGQRQRLELARALVSNPTLLILDEATSAMDPVTEHAVMDNLRRRGCALLVIAHRLSTVRDADLIVVMSGGRVIEQGTHDLLMASGGAYRALVDSATDGGEPGS
jgi:NHLM bacteriocin system ABC transporter peptidase/ATP-binding protein